MNPEQQRIAIAEACGYYKDNQYWCVRTGNGVVCTFEPPDYPNDLNAMHEAEQKMEYWDGYISNLKFICGDPQSEGYSTHKAYRATAAQRAEAFLKTLNLWKNNDTIPSRSKLR